MIPFQARYAALPEHAHVRQSPVPVAAPRWIAFNRPLAEALGVPVDRPDTALLEVFAGNRVPDGARPLAMAYAGHQFGHFVPQLGDGRALLLGELQDREGRTFDVQLKGSGPTPFSRGGDGRAALGPVIREYLVSEAMHALGIPTTRALAAVATGEFVQREQPLPGGVITRVARSHVRVGTFQYFAARGDVDTVAALIDFTLDRLGVSPGDNAALALLDHAVEAQAALVAKWLGVGFIHGVMNTDNCALSGETIDYGPCAFMDTFDPKQVFSSIDRHGRYAYANQPVIAHWNLARLAETLLACIDGDENAAIAKVNERLEAFPGIFERHWRAVFGAKLGLAEAGPEDAALIRGFLDALHAGHADFTLAFRHLAGALDGSTPALLAGLFADRSALDAWLPQWRARLADDDRPIDTIRSDMNVANPDRIPRNHLVERAIRAAEDRDDFSVFERLQRAWARPFEFDEDFADLRDPPADHERVTQTFCGT
ncbi:YdiU family protein [Wenzhouxiangella sp. XN79A]|uniref:protein adenylyltransferase SelO n=1 Tax=Wenzhouxiangella sp. XN79A TaxID=2724193 RepID=UPI00144AB9F5|nr:YdiU family protein [Wenzhouxiangella sp. XN79A]NKI33982.1 YdiU family protein [Wenzhouxiangella sp. XN79A]